MSDTSNGNAKKPMEQPGNDIFEAMWNLSVIEDNSDKISSSKNLSDMPVDVVALVIERSDYKEQLMLQKVSKSLRALVNDQKPACKSLHFHVYHSVITIRFDNQEVVYTVPIVAKMSRQLCDESRYKQTIVVLKGDHEKAGFDDLASTLKNPKLQLDKFEFGCTHPNNDPIFIESARKKTIKQLKALNHQFTVKKFIVMDVSDLPSVLPYLKPEALKSIKICFDPDQTPWNYGAALKTMEKIESLDQWKNAEELFLEVPFEDFPMRYARHFKRFIIKKHNISNDLLLRMRDYFSKCVHFESCTIDHHFTTINATMLNGIGEAAHSKELNVCVVHYSIPNSNGYLEFLFIEKKIEIRKKQHSNNSSL